MNAPIPAWVGEAWTPVPEIDVHRRGLRHSAVAVFLTRDERMLIRQRPRAAYLVPGLWSSACHVHPAWQEPPAICAARWLRDEAPAGTAMPRWRGVVEYRAGLAGGFVEHERVEVFLARIVPGREGPDAQAGPPGDARTDPPEWGLAGRASAAAPEAIWIDVEDLLAEMGRRAERFTPWLRGALSDHLPLILG